MLLAFELASEIKKKKQQQNIRRLTIFDTTQIIFYRYSRSVAW